MEFKPFPKTPRLFRDIVITEKIDGCNAAILISSEVPRGLGDGEVTSDGVGIVINTALDYRGWDPVVVGAQSRKRLVSPGKQTDQAGFAAWVRANAEALANLLGEGVHYGEWWNAQSARKTLAPGEARFSLFNVERYADVPAAARLCGLPGLDCVPKLYEGPFSEARIRNKIAELRQYGSHAAPGFPAEGIVVYHSASGQSYKVLCENDEAPKGQA